MSQKSSAPPARVPAEKLVRDFRRATRKPHSAEDKIRIVLEGLRGEESIAALCRREAIAESLYYAWWNNPTCRSGAASPASASRVRPSTAGMIAFAPVGRRPWPIGHPGPIVSGTASLLLCPLWNDAGASPC